MRKLLAGISLLTILTAAGTLGRLTAHPGVRYDGAETVYRHTYPPISNRDTASDMLRHFNNTPAGKRVVGIDPGPARIPTREWVWTNHKNWQVIVVWVAGPEPVA